MLLVATVNVPARESKEELLPNFHKINNQLYRGAQPLTGGMKELAALGVKTIINLRGEDERTRDEETEAEASGLRYFSAPLPGFGRPNDKQVERVLALINDSQNWPVFIHCRHGQDRTGTIVAIYRISEDGWSSEQAKKEAKLRGMSRFQFGMKDYIGDYYRRWLQRPAEQQPAPPARAVSFIKEVRLVPET
jgi:protein tyrosine/serine phosphatase